ncbi:DUF7519 family protein [Halapricum hydrolyticum]|uniref:Uncharacterized protein n=1 Tax=Halapricum hydrolyticum TaxID=2979991 RepID=A0AAE3IE95_9EURY|nr:hypothetical protein [Halapricum hydrolyticum]MCU4719104.1 hypothetical protein [Halapricum hydrolyticum]MCU4728124.1 hypothetical protein [Halapricum hydrolyticum]
MTVERVPSRAGLVLTGLAGLVAAAGALLGGSVAALAGVPVAILGVYRTSRPVLAVGVALLFVGVMLAGLQDGAPVAVLVAMVGTVLAWDVGENAISMAGQLRTGASGRAEVVHAGAVSAVTLTVAIAGYSVFLLASGGQPGIALSLLVFGTVLVVLSLGR